MSTDDVLSALEGTFRVGQRVKLVDAAGVHPLNLGRVGRVVAVRAVGRERLPLLAVAFEDRLDGNEFLARRFIAIAEDE